MPTAKAIKRAQSRAAIELQAKLAHEDRLMHEHEFWHGRKEPYIDPRDAKIEKLESIIKKYCLLTNKELEDL